MTERDLIVIGAGINGAGIAQAAAAAGQDVLILEQYPTPAAGSSSRSSKLIHGGLRYLESAQFNLVRESLRERAVLLEIAPELVKLVPFHIPVYENSRRGVLQVRAGLSLYAMLGGFHRENRFSRLPDSDWDGLDGLSVEGLEAVFRYYDAQTDDGALTRAVLASAGSLGAELILSARCEGLDLEAEGVIVRYRQGEQARELRARAVVNATGPWVNRLLAMVTPSQPIIGVDLVQGAHLVLPGRLERGIYYVETEDGRAIFAMPWRENILVGTTETPWHNEPSAPTPLDSEIDYLLAGFARYFPEKRAERRNIVASFAGLRVLPVAEGSPFRRSREVILHQDRRSAPRLLSVYGGKLTSFRATAHKAMDVLTPSLTSREARGDTRRLRLEPVD